MTTYVALLRAVNVAGQNKLPMSAFQTLLLDLGLKDARTLLQSGNAVFRTTDRAPARLEGLLEAETKSRLLIETTFFVRTADDWEDVVARNPFPKQAKADPGHLLVMFTKEKPSAGNVKALQEAVVGREVVRANGREIYIVFPDGIGRSKLTNALIERKLDTEGTGRNWNTVVKLGELCKAR